MSADDTTLTPASRVALAHYRKLAEECRADARWLVRQHRPGAAESRTRAATWDALADELAAFAETTGEHDDQGALL